MKQTKTALSILIPVYNTACADFVGLLQRQAARADIDYEIIVADDGSTLPGCVEQNRRIGELPGCEFVVKPDNSGSAATRNFLARRSRHEWLLFLDCDVALPDEAFLSRYADGLRHAAAPVVNGGVSIGGSERQWGHNLRFRYERAEAPRHTAAARQLRPHQSFRSTNFAVRRDVMLACPFDERFTRSGYEDVLLGKQLRQQGVAIAHIDNPVVMTDYEDNATFVAKTERSLRTLHRFRHELRGYSRLLTLADGIHIAAVRQLLALAFRTCSTAMRRNLTGRHPSLTLFKLYRIGYYLNIT